MSPEIINVLRTVMLTGSVLSLLVAMFPILWGEIRAKWLLTGVTSCITFGLVGIMINALAPGGVGEGATTAIRPAGPAQPVRVPWGDVGRVMAVCIALYVAWVSSKAALRALERRRRARATAAEARKAAVDPIAVANLHAPEMIDDVRTAVHRVDRLERIGADPADPVDADALVMARKRLPLVMERLATALDAADAPEEKAELARTALRSVVDIGCMAEEAGRRVADRLRDGLETETRYIAQRTGRAAGDLTAQ